MKRKQPSVSGRWAGQRRRLPIWRHRDAIVDQVRSSQNLVLVSQTASGKTTQVPQFLMEAGLGPVCVTQPRRVACITVAERVAQEAGCRLGTRVGYHVRFEAKYNKATEVKYVTDGMLLREALLDPNLKGYNVVVLDEAHERTVNTDVLFALLLHLQRTKRPDLKIVVMSATLGGGEAQRLATYFNDARVLDIEGRTHPVEVLYTEKPQSDFIDATAVSIFQLHNDYPDRGDILVFMTGQDDIDAVQTLLQGEWDKRDPSKDTNQRNLLVLPFYSALPHEKQLLVFKPTPEGTRKVILSTNIAETSLTIPGIKYIIDTGLVKKKQFFPRTGMEMLAIMPISKAEAWQRAGRAGRNEPGMCLRLYTEATFDGLRSNILPEILRTNLASVLLQLKAIGISNVMELDFLNKPPKDAMRQAIHDLLALEFITPVDGSLTPLGKSCAQLPVDPKFARCLLKASDYGCMREVLIILAMLSVDNVFFHHGKGSTFRKCAQGDHIALLRVYEQAASVSFDPKWCKQCGLNSRTLTKAQSILRQLETICSQSGLDTASSCAGQYDAVLKSMIAGLFVHVAKRQMDGSYLTTLHHQTVHIHPSSCLFHQKKLPDCLLYTELVKTSKQYIRTNSIIDAAWLIEVVPRVFQKNN